MKNILLVSLVVLIMLFSGGFVVGLSSAHQSAQTPSSNAVFEKAFDLVAGTTSASSLNWAGYAVTGTNFTSVTGSFIVPSLSTSTRSSGGHGFGFNGFSHNGYGNEISAAPAGSFGNAYGGGGGFSSTSYAAFWAGIDGITSSTVEQAGVLMESSNGHATYSVWAEFYPSAPVYASWQPSAGNVIVVYVNYTGSSNTFTATVKDLNTTQAFSNTTTVSGAARSSAEWIAEAPSSSTGILPLADFGTVQFGNGYTNVMGSNHASNATISGSISAFPTIYQINMVNNFGSTKASTSTLSSDGTSFTVTWKSS